MKIAIAIILIPIIAILLYVLYCAVIYIYEEICADIKNAKRCIRQAIWDLEWQWNLFKEGIEQWFTKL